jgi:hypothetical protein
MRTVCIRYLTGSIQILNLIHLSDDHRQEVTFDDVPEVHLCVAREREREKESERPPCKIHSECNVYVAYLTILQGGLSILLSDFVHYRGGSHP